jgi:hypothetical protein
MEPRRSHFGRKREAASKAAHLWLNYEVEADDVSVQPLPASHVANINHVMTRHLDECCNSMWHVAQPYQTKYIPLVICFRGTYSEGELIDRRAVQEGHLRFPFSHPHARNLPLARSRNGFSYLKASENRFSRSRRLSEGGNLYQRQSSSSSQAP